MQPLPAGARRAAGFAAAYLALHIAVPLWQLTRPRPARLGWQMYSAAPLPPRVSVELDDGERREVNLNEHVCFRLELDLRALLPPYLCGRVPGARRVWYGAEGVDCPGGR